jgi:hypothetical protein
MNKERNVYRPDRLFNAVGRRLGLSNDGMLSQRLRLRKDLIDEMRYGRTPVTATILLLISEVSGMSIDELRSIMGDRRTRLRLSCRILSTPRAAAS